MTFISTDILSCVISQLFEFHLQKLIKVLLEVLLRNVYMIKKLLYLLELNRIDWIYFLYIEYAIYF